LSALTAGLRSWLPSWTWEAPAGGLTIWARLPGGPGGPGGADSSAFAQAALRRGVAVVPGRLLSAAGGDSSYVRVAFTRDPGELSAACAILAEVGRRL
jgi:DNA-binding transcriptional MocR family regulator